MNYYDDDDLVDEYTDVEDEYTDDEEVEEDRIIVSIKMTRPPIYMDLFLTTRLYTLETVPSYDTTILFRRKHPDDLLLFND